MKRTLLFVLGLIATGCTDPTPRNLDDLPMQGPQYLDPETLEPYSGPAFIETALQATVTIEVNGPDGQSHGSGFVVSSDGMIITAAHVIEGATSALVRLQNGEELNVEGVITIDGARDFAIVRVAGFDLPTVPLGNADDLSVGQRVIVIGAPIDAAYAGTISDGLLAADRLIDGTRILQISAPTSPGNSGGPVLTEQGQVIGLVVSGITGAGAENLNFALPINYVRGQLALAATQPLQALAGAPPDLSSMTPREAADRLFDRVIRVESAGNSTEVVQFLPMAIAAYGLVETLDADGRFHWALLHLMGQFNVEALENAEETLSQQPDHLFGLATAGDASLALGDSASAREYYRRWLDAYETEMAKNLVEYQQHEGVFPEMRATAEALGRND